MTSQMNTPGISTFTYLEADETIKSHVEAEWGVKPARHMHLTGGFSIVVFDGDILVGLISVYRKPLPLPLVDSFDWYIDILEVQKEYRRKGIAAGLLQMICERAKRAGVYQVRSWSSEDKIEAILMWRALGFGLCPALTHAQGEEVRGYFVAKVL
jgi:GNAT superfamily N-acetyltransferase